MQQLKELQSVGADVGIFTLCLLNPAVTTHVTCAMSTFDDIKGLNPELLQRAIFMTTIPHILSQ